MGKSGSEGRGEQTTARKRGIGGSPLTLLPEAQSPDDETSASAGKTPVTGATLCDGIPSLAVATFGAWSVAQ